ncbi:MAG: hypothetical protein ACPLZ9_00015 [Candidatus Ratteibacteria bacterium]
MSMIDDPTRFLFNVWLQRISIDVGGNDLIGKKLTLVKADMAMFQYFNDLGAQVKKMKDEN